MRRAIHFIVLANLALLITASPSLASSIAPPPNLGTLARISQLVVFAEAEGSWNEARGNEPYTVTAFRVMQQVKGERVIGTLEVQEEGGVVGTIGVAVTGVPRFEKGGRYLLFLDPASNGRWQSKMMAYGILREDERTGLLRPIPEAADLYLVRRPGIEAIGTYRKPELLQHLSAVASGSAPWHREAVEAGAPVRAVEEEKSFSTADLGFTGEALHAAPAACRFVPSPDGFPLRWSGFETGGSISVWHTTPGQTGIADGGVSAIQEGVAAWNSHNSSVVNMTYASSRPATYDCADGSAFDPDNEVIFNDPCNQVPELAPTCDNGAATPPHWISPCCGQVARYRTYSDQGSFLTHDGETWRPITGMSIVVNNGAQCVGELDFKEVITHFLGHGVGFDHHEDSNATMHGQLGVHASRGAALAATDLSCANYAYHTFVDVPLNHWSWGNIEAIENAGITKGCGTGFYCPSNKIQRAEMAVFLVRGLHGADFVPPPATGTVFADVPADFWAAAFIEQLFHDGITKGCAVNPQRYCPLGQVTRAEMATFLVRVKHGADFVPPAAEGVFSDVPASYWAAAHIEQIFEDGVTNGCATSPLRYCPETQVIREQMAAFLARIFNLPIPPR